RAGVLSPGGAVVLPALVDVLAPLACLLLGVREEPEHLHALAAGLGGARRGRGGEHALHDRGVLGAVGPLTELAGDVDGADGADRPDAVVGRGGGEAVPAGSADAQ